MSDLNPMVQYLVWAMEGCGAISNPDIYREVRRVCQERGRKLPITMKLKFARPSSLPDPAQWNVRDDFFVWHERGYWSCKVNLDDL
jgi:hypothetical protein